MEAFAAVLFRQNHGIDPDFPFKDADCAFVLAFSLIMLNTDLHNDSIPQDKKMTPQQFVRNNRGINGGGDFPPAYMHALYVRSPLATY